jgi:hypothetical protein
VAPVLSFNHEHARRTRDEVVDLRRSAVLLVEVHVAAGIESQIIQHDVRFG